MQVVADLAAEFHWPHDFWRRIGWRELNAWLVELERRRKAEAAAAARQAALAEQQRQRAQLHGGR